MVIDKKDRDELLKKFYTCANDLIVYYDQKIDKAEEEFKEVRRKTKEAEDLETASLLSAQLDSIEHTIYDSEKKEFEILYKLLSIETQNRSLNICTL